MKGDDVAGVGLAQLLILTACLLSVFVAWRQKHSSAARPSVHLVLTLRARLHVRAH